MQLSLLEKAILVAVLRGVDTLGGLRKLINVGEEELRRAVDRLVALGLLRVERRGLIFKREVLRLTEQGFEEAQRALRELEEAAKRLEDRLEEASVSERPAVLSGLDDIAYIAPLLAWLGLIDLALLAPLAALPVEGGLDEHSDQEDVPEDVDYDEYGDVDVV